MIVLGLGSNLDDRISFLRQAVFQLKSSIQSPQIRVVATSPLYESDALLPAGAPESWNRPYLNLNLLCETTLSPTELLAHLKKLEKSIGRTHSEKWAPRKIDIDILAMDSRRVQLDTLQIPHSSLMERPFALLPLADLLPEWRHLSPQITLWRNQPWEAIPFQTRRSTQCLTECVGILNLTPDSYSDGGLYQTQDAALRQAKLLAQHGISIFDLGGESTRPRTHTSYEITHQEEWSRLEPIFQALSKMEASDWPYGFGIQPTLSIDTRHAEVAKKAVAAGVHWINDVSGFADPEMQKVAQNCDADLVIMHSLSVPPSKDEVLPVHADVVSLILSWAEKRIHELMDQGISRDRIIVDPGIGFGKTAQQSWQILREARRFHDLGVRIFIGHSRKSFLRELHEGHASERDAETAILTADLAEKSIDYLRIHNPESNMRALRTWTQINGIGRCKF